MTPILISKPQDGICLLTLNRPEKRNALDGSIIQDCMHHLKKIAADDTIRVVMLNGNGEHFCAGADLSWMQKMAERSLDENVEDALQLAHLLNLIYTFPKPVIGLIQGATMGGGLGIIACCDIVIASKESTFCFSEVKIGLTPSVISPYILPVIGERNARYYFLTAEKFNTDTAIRLNLIQQIVPLEKLMEAGLTSAEHLLKNSPQALSEAKKIIRQPITDAIMEVTAKHLASMRASEDAKEGLKAFLEKRSPIWR